MVEDHVRTLREHELQVTAQRVAVLRAVTERPHGTASEIADDVRGEIGAISRKSVYDILALLTERGIVRMIRPGGSSARFEDRVGDDHHHLVCQRCERVVDVECVGGAPCLVPADPGEFVVDDVEVTYWGTCPACRAAGSTNHPRTSKETT